MSKKLKTVNLYMNPYYNTVLGSFNIIVPSTKDRYKKNEQGYIIEKPPSVTVASFRNEMRSYLNNNVAFKWPIEGELFVWLNIWLFPNDYKAKDIDNLSKTMLDSMKNIVYKDDSQVKILIAEKHIDQKQPGFSIAIRKLREGDNILVGVPEAVSLNPY